MIQRKRLMQETTVETIFEIIEEGVTFPLKCKLSNGISAVVKYQMNPAGSEVLINEWVGNSIADIIGLTIPRYGVCLLPHDTIQKSEVFGELSFDNSGLAFFSEFIKCTAPVNTEMLKKSSNKETERLLLFDHLIINEDRHNGNLLAQVSAERKVFFIDCSHFLTNNNSLHEKLDIEKEKSIGAVRDNHLMVNPSTNRGPNIYLTLCNTMGFNDRTLLDEKERMKCLLDNNCLREIKESIPAEWRTQSTAQRIDDMFSIIGYRLEHIEDICDMIIFERSKCK